MRLVLLVVVSIPATVFQKLVFLVAKFLHRPLQLAEFLPTASLCRYKLLMQLIQQAVNI